MYKREFIKSIYILLLSVLLKPALYALDVESLFNLKQDGEIVYYQTDELNRADYAKASEIKSKLLTESNVVVSIVIADILEFTGNEHIALVTGANGARILIYSSDGKQVFSYTAKQAMPFSRLALDLDSFLDKGKRVSIIKYYIINEFDGRRKIDLFMFKTNGENTTPVSELTFYNEITSGKVPVRVQVDSVFVDVDNDGIHELVVASVENIGTRPQKIEYLLYKLDPYLGVYVCIVSPFMDEGGVDYSHHFKNK